MRKRQAIDQLLEPEVPKEDGRTFKFRLDYIMDISSAFSSDEWIASGIQYDVSCLIGLSGSSKKVDVLTPARIHNTRQRCNMSVFLYLMLGGIPATEDQTDSHDVRFRKPRLNQFTY